MPVPKAAFFIGKNTIFFVNKLPDMLKNLQLFDSLSMDEIQYLLDHAISREYPPLAIIYSEGGPSDSFAIVIEGELEIIKSFGGHAERIVKVLGQNEVVGEMSLVHQEHYRTATVRARGEVKLLEIPISVFDSLVKSKPELAYELMRIITRRLGDTENAAIEDLQEKNRLLTASLTELREAQAKIIAKEKMEHELRMARRIQQSMLPREIPELPGWGLVPHWQPARSVSGDFYDFISLPNDRLALVVGDVTDKGVPAALLMAVTRSMLRSAAMDSRSPAELLDRVNVLLCPEMPESMFVTCHVAFIDLHTGQLEFSNAGHCLPIWCHDGQMTELRATGLPLGLLPDSKYTNQSVQIERGDRVLYYSDGLVEAHDARGAMFGIPRLMDLLEDNARTHCYTGPLLIEYLMDRLENFTGTADEQEDDITLVYLERSPA